MKIMDKWTPMHDTSIVEDVVIFRMNILRGKILRYQGRFEDSLQSLHSAHDLTKARREIFFDEDFGELIVELADTLQELGNFSRSEALLRKQLTRDHTSATDSILRVSLAECLFARREFVKAEGVCADLNNRHAIPKMARLRLCITAAKLCHVQADLSGAFSWWTEAL
ncbi:hypothetical protein HIM_09122 [Hirsutella minnesotensis 3608]|uniref:MalT-like TPR region domain-containing protein n=1 Tax=Hirsutella minnesotensis 3608 TaxID=1043627 RepID=A0A0F7ZSJ7_9HYPO|nr:hypothetical protein HIM_09122 [Hirsutella minnesotensis 3608]